MNGNFYYKPLSYPLPMGKEIIITEMAILESVNYGIASR